MIMYKIKRLLNGYLTTANLAKGVLKKVMRTRHDLVASNEEVFLPNGP